MWPVTRTDQADWHRSLEHRSFGRHALRALLLATVALTAVGCASDQNLEPSAQAANAATATEEKPGSPASTLLRVARGTRDNGDLASAVTIYKRVHELSPGRTDVLIELGQVLGALGAHNEAADVFREALKKDPKNVDGLRGLGNSLLAMNQPNLALEQFVAGLALRNDPRLYNGMGVVHDMNGSYESAQDSYRSGLKLTPNDPNLRNNLALSLAISGKFDEAIEILRRLAGENRRNPRYRQNLALVYGLAGKFAEAAGVARLDFDEPTVQNNLAYYETLRAMSQEQRAAAVFGITVAPTSTPVPQSAMKATPAASTTAAASDSSSGNWNK
ncbi:MAG TPA: tetratricopeptide repeat protein [Caulobacteraceae bacterium]|nr:tetratricopeptide repeat protein [Caulobacteraceae bacterium]